jgi:tRNA A-37 threonylcarbamoyl transferase component Bud32
MSLHPSEAHPRGPIASCVPFRLPLRDELFERVSAQAGSVPVVAVDEDAVSALPADCSAVVGFGAWAIHSGCAYQERGIPVCMVELNGLEVLDAFDLDRHLPGHASAGSEREWHQIVDDFMQSVTTQWAAEQQAYVTDMLTPSDTGAPTLWRDEIVGRSGRHYRFDRVIGLGGTAIVARVHDEQGTPYAAKALSGHRFPIELTRERFARESRILADVEHPNVLRVLDEAEMDGGPVLIMEHLGGGSLHARLRRSGRPARPTALRWLRATLRGLSALHKRGIVHRDITPKNLLFRSDDQLVISDFGTVRHLDDATLTAASERLGSLLYIPNEQFESPHEAGFVADVYAVGQIGFLLLAGFPPQGNAGRLGDHVDDIPQEIVDAIDAMRAFRARDRPADATAALERLIGAAWG